MLEILGIVSGVISGLGFGIYHYHRMLQRAGKRWEQAHQRLLADVEDEHRKFMSDWYQEVLRPGASKQVTIPLHVAIQALREVERNGPDRAGKAVANPGLPASERQSPGSIVDIVRAENGEAPLSGAPDKVCVGCGEFQDGQHKPECLLDFGESKDES